MKATFTGFADPDRTIAVFKAGDQRWEVPYEQAEQPDNLVQVGPDILEISMPQAWVYQGRNLEEFCHDLKKRESNKAAKRDQAAKAQAEAVEANSKRKADFAAKREGVPPA